MIRRNLDLAAELIDVLFQADNNANACARPVAADDGWANEWRRID
jgi:hypothetical protein